MHSMWLWVGFIALILVLLAIDLGVFNKKPHVIKAKEALLTSLAYIFIALIFNLGVYHYMGKQAGIEFFTGYLIEKSLSVDNIFVFTVIFMQFKIPLQYQHKVLYWGVVGAIVMRGILIALGATLLEQFDWMTYVFGGFLILTGLKMFFMSGQEKDFKHSPLILFLEKNFRFTKTVESDRFVEKKEGKWFFTPLFLALVLVEFTDVIFAFDSIPAIFSITNDPFIVYTTNIFAILGLRSLYFLLAGIVDKFYALKYGLAAMLALVGIKMVVNTYYGGKVFPVEWMLGGAVVLIGASIAYSLLRPLSK